MWKDIIGAMPIIGPTVDLVDFIANGGGPEIKVNDGFTFRQRNLLAKHGIKTFGVSSHLFSDRTFHVKPEDEERAREILRSQD